MVPYGLPYGVPYMVPYGVPYPSREKQLSQASVVIDDMAAFPTMLVGSPCRWCPWGPSVTTSGHLRPTESCCLESWVMMGLIMMVIWLVVSQMID